VIGHDRRCPGAAGRVRRERRAAGSRCPRIRSGPPAHPLACAGTGRGDAGPYRALQGRRRELW